MDLDSTLATGLGAGKKIAGAENLSNFEIRSWDSTFDNSPFEELYHTTSLG